MAKACPTQPDLLEFVMADGARPDAATAAHVHACASCQATVEELQEVLRALEAPRDAAARGGNCLDDVAMAEAIEGVSDADGRPVHAAHLAECAWCRRQVTSLASLLREATIAGELARIAPLPAAVPARPRRARFVTAAVALATAGLAAAALAVMVGRPPAPVDTPVVHRGPTITAADAPRQVSPVGTVAEAADLRWRSVAGADLYRVALFDATGHVLYEARTADTAVTLADSVVLRAGVTYLWKVEARTSWERWTSSELTEFRLRVARGARGDGVGRRVPFVLAAFDPATHHVARRAAPDSLHRIAARLSDSVLAREAHARPQQLRDALALLLARAVRADAAEGADAMRTAHRLAAAYQAAWGDPFLRREVARFAAWPAERRAQKVWADSVRRAGNAAFGRDGPAAAAAIWRRALARLTAIHDTAGMAATLGNMGAAAARDGRADSAARVLTRARALAVAVGDLRVEANAISELAGIQQVRGDLRGARTGYVAASALRARTGDTRGLASDHNNLAAVSRAEGDVVAARAHLDSALVINRRDGRPEDAATNLVNLAAIAATGGELGRAAELYDEALVIWRDAERWADMADALRGLGDLELRRGDYRAAQQRLRAALAIYERTGPVADAIETRRALADASAARGDLQAAVDELRHVQRIADSGALAPALRASIALARADLAARLNARPQAERLYVLAQRLARTGADRATEGAALHGRGLLQLEDENAAAAARMLASAMQLQVAAGDRRGAAITRLSLGAASLQRRDTADARRHLARAAAELERLGDPVASAAAMGERAALEAARDPVAAEALYRAAIARAADRPAPDVTALLHAGLGAVRRGRGDIDGAARALRASIADIERSGRSLALPERRSSYLADKWDAYVQLAVLERARGQDVAAFDVSERLRAGEMLGTLARGRVATGADAAAEPTAREQDLRRRIAELTRELEGTAAAAPSLRGPDVARAGESTRAALLRAQESYAEVLLELRERAPRHAALLSTETRSWRDVSKRLARDEALVEYLVSDSASMAFVVTSDTLLVVSLGARRGVLARRIEFLRGTLQPRGSRRLDSLSRAPLRALHAALVAPIEASGILRGRSRLTIVPHAELHYLPFAALLDGAGGYLVERYELSFAPSASVWLALASRVPARAGTGTIAFGPRPDVLPATREELATIARLGGAGTRTFVGAAATETAFRREAPTRGVIHLATSGVLNKQNPLFSFVELAPGGDDDGRLEAHEVFGLRLAARLVVLSACQTALAAGAVTDVPAGDDWVGLTRAFLSAGAERVMGSLWPVQDRATALLMERFYEAYAVDVDAARSLASAQRALLASPTTANPYYWAGFTVVGGR